MRKIFTQSSRLYTGMLALIALLTCGFAKGATTDFGQVEFGKVYEVTAYSGVKGSVVIPENAQPNDKGKIILYQEGVFDIYLKDSSTNKNLNFNGNGGWGSFGQRKSYEVQAGATYIFDERFIMSGGKVAWYLDGVSALPLEVKSITPARGSFYTPAGRNRISVTFNQDIDFSSADLTQADKKQIAIYSYYDRIAKKDTSFYTETLTIGFGGNNSLLDFSINGVTKASAQKNLLPGDTIFVKFGKNIVSKSGKESLKDNVDAEGYYHFWYRLASKVKNINIVKPEEFLSYWAPGDEKGIIKIDFDGEISIGEQTYAAIGYGNLEGEEGEYYYERIVPTLSEDKKSIIVDLTGKMRTPQTMTPLYADAGITNIGVSLYNVVDQYGAPVQNGNETSYGSYGWDFPYKELERTAITAEFTPANGSSLEGAENIEVYLTPVSKFSFSGFAISYADGKEIKTVNVKKEDAKVVAEEAADAATYTFAIPAEVKGKKNVTITLADFVCNDGYDHSEDVKAQYDTFVITYSEPANGEKLEKLAKGQVIKIETNYSEKYPNMYIMYQVRDMNPVDPMEAVVRTQSWMTRQDDGSYTASISRDVKLLSNHTYHIEFTAWETEQAKNYKQEPIGDGYVSIEGATAPYIPSDIKFVSIDPADGSMLGEEAPTFTVKFDGLVNLAAATTFINEGQGMTQAFASITPLDPEDYEGVTYSPEWKLVVPEEYFSRLNAPLEITIVAVDMQNRRVQGNNGKEDTSNFQFSFKVPAMYADYELTVDGKAPYASVEKFIASSQDGISFSYQHSYKDAYVMTQGREIVAYVSDVVMGEGELGQKNIQCILTLDNAITAEGSYVLVVPEYYFEINEEFDAQQSKAKTFAFDVTGGAQEEFVVKCTPEAGIVLSLPKEIEMVVVGYSTIGLGSGAPTLTIDDNEPIKLDDVTLDNDIYNMATINLPQEYTEAGKYVISFPAGYILLGDNGDPAPAFTVEYEIEAVSSLNVTADPAEGKVVSLPAEIVLTFVDYSTVGGGSGKATISFNGGEAVNLPDAYYGVNENQMNQPLDKAHTEDGTYVISFPVGYFGLGDGGDASPAFKLTYIVDKTGGISGVVVDSEGKYNVYNLSGMKVISTTDKQEVLNLDNGIYIINNVKVYIKK